MQQIIPIGMVVRMHEFAPHFDQPNLERRFEFLGLFVRHLEDHEPTMEQRMASGSGARIVGLRFLAIAARRSRPLIQRRLSLKT